MVGNVHGRPGGANRPRCLEARASDVRLRRGELEEVEGGVVLDAERDVDGDRARHDQ